MQFQHNFTRRTADIQIHHSNHRQKITGQNDEKKNTNGKQCDEKKTDTKIGKVRCETEKQTDRK